MGVLLGPSHVAALVAESHLPFAFADHAGIQRFATSDTFSPEHPWQRWSEVAYAPAGAPR